MNTTNAVYLVIDGKGSRVTTTQAGGDIEQDDVQTKREASPALRV